MRQTRWIIPLTALLALGIGLGVGFGWQKLRQPAEPASAADGDGSTRTASDAEPDALDPALLRELAALGQAVQEEAEARRQLEWELGILRELIASLEQRLASREAGLDGETEGRREAEARFGQQPGAPAGELGGSEEEGAPPSERPIFDEQALIELGVDPVEAERLRQRYEEAELERLYLRDQAVREGWAGTRRHFNEGVRVELELRQELGEERYDQMLYALGRNNRVVVRDVLSDSPAEQAGLEPGDVVLSYGDRRIFRAQELQNQTARGEAGDYVRVDVVRDGERRTISVPRGPLGAVIRESRLPPEPGR